VLVVARKRPLFEHEAARGEFDALSMSPGVAALHVCHMAPDLKGMFMRHHEFGVGLALGESSTNGQLCASAIVPLLEHVAAGGASTAFMYGQTGSGKTHTMAGIEQVAAATLLPAGCAAASARLQYFEVRGDRCVDLLVERGKELMLANDASGVTHVLGSAVVCVGVRSSEAACT